MTTYVNRWKKTGKGATVVCTSKEAAPDPLPEGYVTPSATFDQVKDLLPPPEFAPERQDASHLGTPGNFTEEAEVDLAKGPSCSFKVPMAEAIPSFMKASDPFTVVVTLPGLAKTYTFDAILNPVKPDTANVNGFLGKTLELLIKSAVVVGTIGD
jgi:hypothetical protein